MKKRPTPWRVHHTPAKGRAGPKLVILDADNAFVLELGGYWNEDLGKYICDAVNAADEAHPMNARTKWESTNEGSKHSRKYGDEITTRNTLFQIEGEVNVFNPMGSIPARVVWYLQPTGLSGRVERSTDGSTDAKAIAQAKRQCDEAARKYARSILTSIRGGR